MALFLKLTDSKGISCNYHRVISQTQVYDGVNEGIFINLAGYTNASYRTLEKASGESMIVMNIPVFLPFNNTALSLSNIYTRIKSEVDTFIPSTDI